ncbi:MAG: RsmD family RNA methyltransferase [Deltaproteobacteria bacterium]|nr:RsmD family RNA methyltransferase [Deltaproteobacteria bacterium]
MKVRIEDWNGDGRGRGTLGSKTVLVSQAHPGEEVSVRLDRKTRGTLQGRVLRLIAADPTRIPHSCRHEFRCTGCPFLAADDHDEADFKVAKVTHALRQAGAPEEALQPLQVPAGPFGYRHLAKQATGLFRGKVMLGSYVAGTHEVANNAGCPVLVPELATVLEQVRQLLIESKVRIWRPAGASGEGGSDGLRHVVARQSRATGEQLLVLVTSTKEGAVQRKLCDVLVQDLPTVAGAHLLLNEDPGNTLRLGESLHVSGLVSIEENLGGFRHLLGPRSTFRINPLAAEVLVQEILEAAGEGKVCLEPFSGEGALTLPLTRGFERVLAAEKSPDAVDRLRKSAQGADLLDRIPCYVGRAEALLPTWLEEENPDCAVLAPPKKGLGPVLLGALGTSRLSRIVLLSSDPLALAHDLPPLLASGFQLSRVTPIDSLPRTAHVDTVSLLTRE